MASNDTLDISIDLPTTCSCDATLTAADYIGMQRPYGDNGLPTSTGKFHAFDCSACDETHYVCPVCDGGSFETPDCGTLICHNCRPKAAARQDRDIKRRRRSRRGVP